MQYIAVYLRQIEHLMRIGITNLKGGVGKTTLSINLAVCFAHMGFKVCIVDTDTNQNSMAWLRVREDDLPRVMVVGATDPLVLHKTVNQLHDDYEIVIMDGTPNLSPMNTRIMLCSDLLLIPTRPGAHDVRAMEEFMLRLDQVRETKSDIVALFLINEYNERIEMHRVIRRSLDRFELRVLEHTLKSRTVYGESNYNGLGVYEDEDLKAKEEIIKLCNEILSVAKDHHLLQMQ